MIPLYTKEEFELAKSVDLLPCKCTMCSNTFYKQKRVIKRTFTKYNRNTGDFCSRKCKRKSEGGIQNVSCTNCGKIFEKHESAIKKSKSGNHFCSKSCGVTYNNKHKTTGNRRSKLEIYLEKELIKSYPNLIILFNNNKAINSELDIYIPSLKLAFELNGIFHYEQIFSQETFIRTQNNDKRKFQACIEQGIELCVIDTSQQKYFKEQTSQKYLNIILNIINIRLHPLVR
jgi:hypothetical protein